MNNASNLLASMNIDKKKYIITAVSGGLDSMALLAFLVSEDYTPIVVHFNHNTRETNMRDKELVTDYCIKYNIKHNVFDISVDKGNFQSNARDLRYSKLRTIALEYQTPYIATAHHLDDLAETILIKITRGSNLYGYAGIHPIFNRNNFTYIKPFLHTSKNELLNYSTTNNIPFFEDESNYEDNYLRNRYRHSIIPILKQENNQFLEKALNYSKQLTMTYNYINAESKKHIVNNSINLSEYKNLDIVIQNEILAILLNEKNLKFTNKTVNDIRKMLLNDKPNSYYTLEDGYIFNKAYLVASILKESILEPFEVIINDETTTIPNIGIFTLLKEHDKSALNIVEICYNRLSLPLIARTRKQGDILSFKYGRKKLKDYLIDQKVPLVNRNNIWLLTDSDDTILWVSNLYVNETLGNENNLKFIIGEFENE